MTDEQRDHGRSRERLLGQARADLVALPDLVAELARLVADKNHDVSSYGGKVIGSPAPLQLPVVHLVGGGQHRPAWHGEDPRQPRWALTWYARDRDERTARTTLHPTEDAAWRAFHRQTGLPGPLEAQQMALARITRWRARDQYGAEALLESWVRVLCEEWPETHELAEEEAWVGDRLGHDLRGMPELAEVPTVRTEAAVLLEHWALITEQQWASELAEDVTRIAGQVRAQLGIRPEPKYTCPQCGNPAYLQPGGILACTEQPDHDIVVRDLEQQWRRRPALPTRDICELFEEQGVTEGLLRQWKFRRRITPARVEERGKTTVNWWLPWDVFCLVNPDIAEAFEHRDTVDAE